MLYHVSYEKGKLKEPFPLPPFLPWGLFLHVCLPPFFPLWKEATKRTFLHYNVLQLSWKIPSPISSSKKYQVLQDQSLNCQKQGNLSQQSGSEM